MIFILTMVFQLAGAGTSQGPAVAITQEYRSQELCKAAMNLNREKVRGSVMLATCTAK